MVRFGKIIKGLKIDGKPAEYPVLNERDARAGAGIMLMLGGIAFSLAFLRQEYIAINVLVILFLTEFSIRLIDPSIAPFYFLGSLVVKKMRPEYTGAAQKRFAWFLGFLMALSVFSFIYIFQIRGVLNLSFCIACLGLLWLESSFGICLGCKMYYGLIKLKLVKEPVVKPACPGGVCPI